MPDFPAMTLVSGAPGTGKTTISKALARIWQDEGGKVLLLDSDVFFAFPIDLISPDLPEARAQNETVSQAVALSAITFAEAGYNVILDGVIGPWMLPHYLKVFQGRLSGLSYVILQAPLDITLERARTREDGDKFYPEGVKHMHSQFEDLKAFKAHGFDTGGLSPDETIAELDKKLRARDFQFLINA